MGKQSKPRAGSLQYWPRKRARKILPSVNWNVSRGKEKRLLGFLAYKVGMLRVLVKDLTPHSMTKNKQIILPATIVECPPMKILSARFYKNHKAAGEILSENADKDLKRRLKLPKQPNQKKLEEFEKNLSNYDDIRIIVYSVVSKTGIKKAPDIAEIALSGTLQEKFALVKELMNKEITIENVFDKTETIDVHAVTKGKGLQGPVKRFGISLKPHKTEKGLRRPGTLGPWKPSRVTFRAPLAGQLGFFSRIQFNNKIISIGNDKEINQKSGFDNYGIVKNHYLIVKGSLQGPSKRVMILTHTSRPSKSAVKQNFEIVKILD